MNTDVLIIGSGLGATAAAKALADAGQVVVVLRGVGCSRSPHLDGGVVDPDLVAMAFGPGAPLGQPVHHVRTLTMMSRDRFEPGPATHTGSRVAYRRNVLEDWAMSRAVSAGAVVLEDFIEGKALPNGDGSMTLTSERDDRKIRAGITVLCEGADPRIPMRVKLRPDYGPGDQLHFARTVVSGATLDTLIDGDWRTSWGMPVGIRLVPQDDGVIVSVVARIENVMRSSRSTAEALEDLLTSPACATLNVDGERDDTGMELVALRPNRRDIRFAHDRLLMGIDASGVIDPRGLNRADLTIQGGLQIARFLRDSNRSPDTWPDMAAMFVRDAIPGPDAYHEDRATGYLEEGVAGGRVAFVAKVSGLLRRGG